MHDPMTQAFQICWPWKARGCSDYHTPIITIWHVDPETDGSDDSCGYSRPRLSKDQLARIRMIAGDEARQPYFQRFRGKEIDSPTEAETLLRQAFMLVGKIFSVADSSGDKPVGQIHGIPKGRSGLGANETFTMTVAVALRPRCRRRIRQFSLK